MRRARRPRCLSHHGGRVVRAIGDTPIVYGSPGQIAACFDSFARLVESEPDETFSDPVVRNCGQRLAELIHRRITDTTITVLLPPEEGPAHSGPAVDDSLRKASQ
jgi:hypothetical protein